MKVDNRVAIVMPMYNASQWIERAIDSVLKQTHHEWKLYIVDDCSNDGSVELIKAKYNDERIKIFLNDRNLGAARTRNRALDFTEEKIVCFIDSDDEWLDDKLSLQLSAIKDGYNLICSEYYYVNKNINIIKYRKQVLTRNKFLMKQFRVCFSSVCINFGEKEKEHFKIIGHEDFEYLSRCFDILGGGVARVIEKPIVKYYCQKDSLSSNKVKAAKWHYSILKDELGLSFLKRFFFFGCYIFNALLFSKKNK